MKTLLSLILKAALGWFAGWIGGYLQRRKLANETARADQAEQTVAQDTRVIQNVEVRHEVEAETAKLPDATIQRVGDADPHTAAGELRDQFSRD